MRLYRIRLFEIKITESHCLGYMLSNEWGSCWGSTYIHGAIKWCVKRALWCVLSLINVLFAHCSYLFCIHVHIFLYHIKFNLRPIFSEKSWRVLFNYSKKTLFERFSNQFNGYLTLVSYSLRTVFFIFIYKQNLDTLKSQSWSNIRPVEHTTGYQTSAESNWARRNWYFSHFTAKKSWKIWSGKEWGVECMYLVIHLLELLSLHPALKLCVFS